MKLMARPIPGHPYTKEDLLDVSAELKGAGLSQAAALMKDVAPAHAGERE